MLREPSVLRIVVGVFHVVDARRDRDRAAQVRPGTRQAGEAWQRIERQVDLAGRGAKFVAAYAFDEIGGQLAFVHELQERQVRIDARYHDLRVDLVAVGQRDANRSPVLRNDARDRSLGSDLDTELARRRRDRLWK